MSIATPRWHAYLQQDAAGVSDHGQFVDRMTLVKGHELALQPRQVELVAAHEREDERRLLRGEVLFRVPPIKEEQLGRGGRCYAPELVVIT
jgi:hypothetical protein